MGKAKTSPQTWRAGVVEAENRREKGERHWPVFDEDSGCVAHAWSKEHALLIAAAPELKAELIAARNDLIRWANKQLKRGNTPAAALDRIASIDAALAKSEGSSNG